jgi:hypothetical protein
MYVGTSQLVHLRQLVEAPQRASPKIVHRPEQQCLLLLSRRWSFNDFLHLHTVILFYSQGNAYGG